MSHSYWRTLASRAIEKVLDANLGCDEAILRKKISEAYPFGPRQHHPYKIWCDEVKKVMAWKFPKPLTAKDLKGSLFEFQAAMKKAKGEQ